MPAGVSWGQYLKFTSAAMLSMFAGAQMIHIFYRPMDDFDKYVKEALEKEKAAAAALKKNPLKKTTETQQSESNSQITTQDIDS